MSETLNVALTQLTTVDDSQKNLNQIVQVLEKINTDVDIVFFPENCLYMRIIEGEKVPFFKLEDPLFQTLADEAKKRNLILHLGSVPIELPNGKYNCSVVIDQQGQVIPSYQKIHLFDIQLTGQNAIQESDVFNHGEKPSILKVKDWKIGQSICYDLRFSELYRAYAEQEVDLIIVPSAFLVKTGQAHWEVLLRARAIESQSYVLASAQSGQHQSTKSQSIRETYGQAMVVDPWGQILKQMGNFSPAIEVISLSKHRVAEVRRQIPMKNRRRI